MKRITRKPRVKIDLLQHFVYIGERNSDAAERFLRAAREAVQDIARMPTAGGLKSFHHPELAGIRSLPIDGFKNYLIFYRETKDGIEVLRVLHGARDIERVLT
ncbi:MAG TPA: type II toxin-antitoxin system RelE/ParE family toxin, partial [Tepidisphaeraceae bacterium]|nr:type II toxin-antitoxin system RelE/ParE family toxin [Tepidisphaeraceae bacterium]